MISGIIGGTGVADAALLPQRHQFFPANNNPGAVSTKCAAVGTSYFGPAVRTDISAYGHALHRCSSSHNGGYAYVYLYSPSNTKVTQASAHSPSGSVRTIQIRSAYARCSLYPGPNKVHHLLECVSRY